MSISKKKLKQFAMMFLAFSMVFTAIAGIFSEDSFAEKKTYKITRKYHGNYNNWQFDIEDMAGYISHRARFPRRNE